MTNTPSPDEDRELIEIMREAEWDDYESCLVGVRLENCHKAADRLESLLSDRANLEEALALDKATVDAVLVAVDNRSVPTMDATWPAAWNAAMDFVSKAIVEARTALNRSTDRG